ncbi:hypothetical protein [Nitrincola sp.]|uniref:hypothetical protein n=1 Tax=Nitrincola sp. TaxID=1926584 RepID=UPI003A91B74F
MPIAIKEETLNLPLSKVQSPALDALIDIEQTSLALSSRQPVYAWLDASDMGWFLRYNPVMVIQVSRHFEVVAGFRTYHAAISILDPDEQITVQRIRKVEDIILVKGAFYELVSQSLMHTPTSSSEGVEAYDQLRKLSLRLRKQHGLKLPEKFSAKSLKSLFGVKSKEMRPARKRKSELTRLMEE